MKTVKEALDYLEGQVREQSRAEEESQVTAAFIVARAFLDAQERQALALESISAKLGELTAPEPEPLQTPVATDGATLSAVAEA